MAYDSDLRGAPDPRQQYSIVTGGSGNSAQAYTNPSGRAGLGSLLMAVFAGLNLLFLLIAASYSTGLFENIEATSDGTTFFVLAVMTFIAGGLGLFCSYVGLRLSRLSHNPVLELVHKAIFILIMVASSLVLIGPVFN